MTGTQVIQGLRYVLDDQAPAVDGNYKYAVPVLLFWVNTIVDELRALRTDLAFDESTGERLAAFSWLTDAAQAIPLPAKMMSAVIDGVAARCYEMEAGDAFDAARAKHHFERYIAERVA